MSCHCNECQMIRDQSKGLSLKLGTILAHFIDKKVKNDKHLSTETLESIYTAIRYFTAAALSTMQENAAMKKDDFFATFVHDLNADFKALEAAKTGTIH